MMVDWIAFGVRFRSLLVAFGAFVLVAGVLVVLRGWQPERQVERHFERWVLAVEGGSWSRVETLTAAEYSDAWGFDRERMIREGRELLRHFFSPHIVAIDPEVVIESDTTGRVISRFRIEGEGTAMAGLIKQELAQVDPVFVFVWERSGWRPWRWRLVSVASDEIRMSKYRSFP